MAQYLDVDFMSRWFRATAAEREAILSETRNAVSDAAKRFRIASLRYHLAFGLLSATLWLVAGLLIVAALETFRPADGSTTTSSMFMGGLFAAFLLWLLLTNQTLKRRLSTIVEPLAAEMTSSRDRRDTLVGSLKSIEKGILSSVATIAGHTDRDGDQDLDELDDDLEDNDGIVEERDDEATARTAELPPGDVHVQTAAGTWAELTRDGGSVFVTYFAWVHILLKAALTPASDMLETDGGAAWAVSDAAAARCAAVAAQSPLDFFVTTLTSASLGEGVSATAVVPMAGSQRSSTIRQEVVDFLQRGSFSWRIRVR